MTDGSLLINTLISNICLGHGHENVFQTDVTTVSKMVNHFFFAKKLKILYVVYHTIMFQTFPACCPNTYQIMYRETLDVQCQHLVIVADFQCQRQ